MNKTTTDAQVKHSDDKASDIDRPADEGLYFPHTYVAFDETSPPEAESGDCSCFQDDDTRAADDDGSFLSTQWLTD